MTRKHSETRFSVGELVELAYKEAGRLTPNSRLAAILASRMLEKLIATSDRPDLVHQLQSAAP
jgi:hypothetical protein